jgi:hypothetical protein
MIAPDTAFSRFGGVVFPLLVLSCSVSERPADGDGPDATPSASSRKDGGTRSPEPTYAPTFSAIYAEVIQPHNCLLGLCHGEGAAGGGLVLFPRERAYDALIAASNSRECAHLGLGVVEPENPDESLFWIKLQADPPCGVPMPPDELVEPRHVEQVRLWIVRGAPEN